MVSKCTEEKIAKLWSSNIFPRKINTSLQNKLVKDTLKGSHERHFVRLIHEANGSKKSKHPVCLENLE